MVFSRFPFLTPVKTDNCGKFEFFLFFFQISIYTNWAIIYSPTPIIDKPLETRVQPVTIHNAPVLCAHITNQCCWNEWICVPIFIWRVARKKVVDYLLISTCKGICPREQCIYINNQLYIPPVIFIYNCLWRYSSFSPTDSKSCQFSFPYLGRFRLLLLYSTGAQSSADRARRRGKSRVFFYLMVVTKVGLMMNRDASFSSIFQWAGGG